MCLLVALKISGTENGYIFASGFQALRAEAGKGFNADGGLGSRLAQAVRSTTG